MPSTVFNTFKYFTGKNKNLVNEDHTLYLSVLLSLGNGIFRPIWGLLLDYIGFKYLMAVALLLQIICSISLYFAINSLPIIYIIIILISSIAACPFTIIPAMVYKKYGTQNGSDVYGVIFVAFGLSAITAPIISKSIDLSHAIDQIPYLIIYSTGTIFSILGLVITYLIDVKPIEKE